MRFGLRAYAAIVSACLAGCALIAGLDDSKGDAGPVDAGGDRITQGEGGPILVDGAPCEPKELPESTVPEIAHVSADEPITIDGNPKEWGCVDRLVISQGDRRVDTASGAGLARIALQWDEEFLYLTAKVTTSPPNGTAGADLNYKNDSFHWLVMGPAPGTEYTAQDHHITIDVFGQATDFSDVAGIRPNLDGIVAKATGVSPGPTAELQTFDVEIRATAKTLGRTTFRAGDIVQMNFQINDGPPAAGKTAPAYRIWFLDAGTCPITTACNVLGTSEPYCNPRCTRGLRLR